MTTPGATPGARRDSPAKRPATVKDDALQYKSEAVPNHAALPKSQDPPEVPPRQIHQAVPTPPPAAPASNPDRSNPQPAPADITQISG